MAMKIAKYLIGFILPTSSVFTSSEVERIVRNSFAKNIVLTRYFADDSRGSLLAAILRLGFEESPPLRIPFARSRL